MATVRELHDKAMARCDQATLAKRLNPDAYQSYLLLALPFEKRAADMATAQPSRAILYLSAASIAYEAGEYGQANVLAANGYTGAPDEIAAELRALGNKARQKIEERR